MTGWARRCALALTLVAMVEGGLFAADDRGPFEAREEFLPAQARLALTALSAAGLPAGQTWLRIDFDWGSDFAWRQHVPVAQAGREGYLIDGEHRTLALGARRGFAGGWTLGLRVPVEWRGGGILDRLIDGFHRAVTSPLGLNDNGRPSFPRDQLRIEGPLVTGEPLRFTGHAGAGLGNLELLALRSLGGTSTSPTRLAAVGRVALPTATGQFSRVGTEVALQLLLGRATGSRGTLHLGLGGVASADTERQGLRYSHARGQGFAGFEWRVGSRASLIGQVEAASRMLTNIRDYPALQAYLRLGIKRDLGQRWQLELGFAENLADQQATTDFSIWLGLSRRIGS